MITDFIVDLTDYLNDNGFSISGSDMQRCFKLMENEEFDITNENSILSILKLTFSKNQAEYGQLEELFKKYLKHEVEIKKAKQEKEEKAAALKKDISNAEVNLEQQYSAIVTAESELDTKLQSLHAKKNQMISDARKKEIEKIDKPLFTEKKAAKLQKGISGIKYNTESTKQIVEKILSGKEKEIGLNELPAALREISTIAEKALRDGDLQLGMCIMELQKPVKSWYDIQKDADSRIRIAESGQIKKIEKEEQNYKDQLQKMKRQYELEKKKYQKNKMQMDQLLKDLNNNTQNKSEPQIIQKTMAKNHRLEFIGGKNAVQALYSDIQNIAEKDFKKLSDQERKKILYYVRKNILAFKTRMTRNIRTGQHRSINMEQTIFAALHTGGLPMEIIYDKPNRSKSDLILVLDVSGSCKEASEMMLKFIGILKDVFPRGCKAFAFVNSLYDISEVYETDDLDIAVQKALDMIPRRGVYSNYEIPLRTLWNEYKHEITKDSLVIFIGDARNNKNDSGEYYLKNICRKAKHAYWLNTESVAEWCKADSLAGLYGKYAVMHETKNSAELIQFISKLH